MSSALHPTENKVYLGGMDNIIAVYDYSDPNEVEPKKLKELCEHDGYVGSLKFASNTSFVSAGGDAKIVLWDASRHVPITKFYGHEGDAGSIDFPREKCKSFISSSTDGTVRVWDMNSGKCSHIFKTSDEVNQAAFFPSGGAVAAGCHNGETFLFDLRSMCQLQKFVRKGARVSGIQFSFSGRILYAAYEDGFVGL